MIYQSETQVRFGASVDTHNVLQKGVYRLDYDNRKEEYFLARKPSFKLPSRLFGDHSITQRWLNSYNTYGKTGILLTGPAGTGKTITAVKFCVESDLPVIIIDEAHTNGLLDFLSNPELGNCIIFIDEFEKIYNREEQNVFLSILDGQYPTKLVFLFTINDEFRVNDFLKNRLGRVKFKKQYTYLTREEAEEIIDASLVVKEYKEELINEIIELGIVTIDILKHMIDEINLQELRPKEIVKMLSLYPVDKTYSLRFEHGGLEYILADNISLDDESFERGCRLNEPLQEIFGTSFHRFYGYGLVKEGDDYQFEQEINDTKYSFTLKREIKTPFYSAF